MSTTKITELTTGETIATVDEVCFVDIHKALKFSDEAYHVLELSAGGLEKMAEATCKPEVSKRLSDALGDKDAVKLGFHTLDADTKWKITGRVRNRTGTALGGLRVLAYDKDTVKADDFLGCAFTDGEGRFEIGYEDSDFKSETALIDFEGNPDVYLEVADIIGDGSKRTVTMGEADKEEHFELKIDLASKTRQLRPIVGYYFIEEDMLEREVESLGERIERDSEDVDAHFLLGLCYVEKMKLDLRKAEWVLAEMRNENNVLAVSALAEFNKVISLDPEREKEIKRYRDYVEKLKDLAL